MYKCLPFLALILFSLNTNAQMKQGDVVYSIKIEGMDEISEEMLSGTNMQLTFNKKMSKVVLDMVMMRNTTIIDLKTEEGVILFDGMDQKIKMPIEQSKMTNQLIDDYQLVSLKEKKILAGYECRLFRLESDQGEFTICLTDDIQFESSYNFQLADLKGFPLEYSMNYAGMLISLTATDIKKRRVKKKEFIVPNEYKEMQSGEMGLF